MQPNLESFADELVKIAKLPSVFRRGGLSGAESAVRGLTGSTLTPKTWHGALSQLERVGAHKAGRQAAKELARGKADAAGQLSRSGRLARNFARDSASKAVEQGARKWKDVAQKVKELRS